MTSWTAHSASFNDVKELAASVIVLEANHSDIYLCICTYWFLTSTIGYGDINSGGNIKGKGQGSIVSVEEGVRAEIANKQLFTRVQWGDTLRILVEKQPERRPGDRQWTSDKKEVESCHMESIRTQWQQTGPCLEGQPLRQPGTWPNCLGRGIHITLPFSPRSVHNPPSPVPSSSSSDSSGPPSLESITEPESGYEASVFLSSDTE